MNPYFDTIPTPTENLEVGRYEPVGRFIYRSREGYNLGRCIGLDDTALTTYVSHVEKVWYPTLSDYSRATKLREDINEEYASRKVLWPLTIWREYWKNQLLLKENAALIEVERLTEQYGVQERARVECILLLDKIANSFYAPAGWGQEEYLEQAMATLDNFIAARSIITQANLSDEFSELEIYVKAIHVLITDLRNPLEMIDSADKTSKKFLSHSSTVISELHPRFQELCRMRNERENYLQGTIPMPQDVDSTEPIGHTRGGLDETSGTINQLPRNGRGPRPTPRPLNERVEIPRDTFR